MILRLNDGRAGCLRGPLRRAVPSTHRHGKNIFEVHVLATLRIGSVDLRTTGWLRVWNFGFFCAGVGIGIEGANFAKQVAVIDGAAARQRVLVALVLRFFGVRAFCFG